MYKISKKSLIILIFLTINIALIAQGTLSGNVKNSDGVALRAHVVLPNLNKSTDADENGNYSLKGIPAGSHLVTFFKNGYEGESSTAVVTNNNNTTLDVIMNVFSRQTNEVVVTGVTNPKSTLESSISISSLKAKDINNAVARTTAEIFRTIPGIRSESSGGEGNSNITVRGVPVSAGGSRYMLIQEDGLPVLQFGDVSFGTQDQFVRYDNTVSRIEALRGGSASVLTSNSPAGIVNFISKNGETEGGSISTTLGLNYQNLRTDFEYGSPLGNNLFFHVGGFYRAGDGPRKTGYISNNGGQIKANLTKKFENGFVRLYAKVLEDRTAAYMPMPISVSGSDDNPTYSQLGAFDPYLGALQSPQLMNDVTIGGDGNKLRSNVADGMHSSTKSIGAEFNFNFKDGWALVNKGRMAFNSGQFLAPFPASVASSSTLTGATYADNGLAVDPTGYYMTMHLFNTKLNNFNNFVNDFSISKSFDNNKVKITAGLYKSLQNINMDWHWNTYLMEANSATNNRLINTSLTTNGQLAYGVPGWGNCCNRNYATTYNINAPYVNLELAPSKNWNFDLGLRYDLGQVNGSFSGGNGQTATIDMNGNGSIDSNERAVATTSNTVTPVNYDYSLLSYSFGANYKVNDNVSVFARASQGGSASADRILFNGSVSSYSNTNDPVLDAQKVNKVSQYELGSKYRKNNVVLNATLFYAYTTESNYEATKQLKTSNEFRSMGLELDGSYKFNNQFSLRGGLTYTNAAIAETPDSFTNKAGLKESFKDKTPRRLPAIMANITPVFTYEQFSIGATILAYTASYTQNTNELKMPGYVVVNPFANYSLNKNMNFGLQANNLFNALGLTEAEENSMGSTGNAIIRARPIPGRSISMSFRYNF